MSLDALTPTDTTVVLIDFAIGFANIFRSQSLAVIQNNAQLLADTALTYGSGLVVTNGPPEKSSGPLLPKLMDVLGNHPIVIRGGMFNAFLFEGFKKAVEDTGRRNVVVAGLVTEGCVLQTVLGGLREGYAMHVAVDTCASPAAQLHDAAVQRMVQAGAVPVTAFALTSEFQVDQGRPDAQKFFDLTSKYQPELAVMAQFFDFAEKVGKGEAT